MKKIIISICILLVAFVSNVLGQPPTGSVNYRPDLDKFIGTWKWNDGGGNEVTLMLKKIMYYEDINSGYQKEKLVACHKYIKNGVTIQDNLYLYPSLGQNETGSGLFSLSKPYRIRGMFKDSLQKWEELRLSYNGSTPTPTLTWGISLGERTYRIGIDPVPSNATTLPKSLVLVKQP
jgi:hypothetical protein